MSTFLERALVWAFLLAFTWITTGFSGLAFGQEAPAPQAVRPCIALAQAEAHLARKYGETRQMWLSVDGDRLGVLVFANLETGTWTSVVTDGRCIAPGQSRAGVHYPGSGKPA